MSGTLTGAIKQMGKERTITEKFKVKELVLETEDRYPEEIKIQFVNDRVDLLYQYKVGDKVEIFYDIRGNRSKDGKVFNNINGWRIQTLASSPDNIPAQSNTMAPIATGTGEELDDLPF